MSELVRVETSDGVCTVTLHRPEARNALNTALLRASAAALEAAEGDDDVAVVVLTGADPAFCAGLDLKELAEGGANLVGGRTDDGARWSNPIQAVWEMTKPVIGAVNGACVTGGFELALGCDFLVASDRARFGDTHARVGVTPGGGMSVFLPMAVGLRKAKEMTLTGNFVDGAEAHRLGLVNHVVPHAELMPTAQRLARDIAGNDRGAIGHLKQLYDHNARLTVGDALAHEHEIFGTYRVDFDAIEQRRQSVVERGSSQH